MLNSRVNRELLAVFLSVLVQLPLAIFLGHYYDQRLSMDTGYLVSSGLNPYQQYTITIFSSNPHLIGLNPIIGYPPLWPLLLGLIYHITFNLTPNLFLYNFAIKIPVIASNIALAYVTKMLMQSQNMPPQRVQFAWLFLLFNPLTLLTTTAWGQFDTLIAFLCISAIYFLSKGLAGKATILLSLSFVLKPISLPLLGLPLFAPLKNRKKSLVAFLIIVSIFLLLAFLPFYLLGWVLPASSNQVTSYFRMAGGLTLFSVVELIKNTAILPIGLEFLGYLWVPALILGYIWVYLNPPKNTCEFITGAIFLLLVFFLTRSWVSEPNLNLFLPLFLILLGYGKISDRLFHLSWILPLVFIFLNYSFPQLFFLVYPPIMLDIAHLDMQIGIARLAARFVVSVLWYIVAIKILFEIINRKAE